MCRLLPQLLLYVHERGYEATLGDAYRDPRAFGKKGVEGPYGHPKSAHKMRLAIDLNLFRDGIYLTSTEDYLPIGTYWKSLHPLCRSGIDFDDGNHFSIIYAGMK